MNTYNNLYLEVRKQLRGIGVYAAQLEARELICCAAGKTREQFYRDLTLYASDTVEQKLKELVARRLAGEPVAYLVGEWEFYGLSLHISPEVLIPRPDTEVLAERAIQLAEEAGEGARVLDLCAGSGCIGLAVAAQVSACRVVLVDVSKGAIQICKQNIRRNSLNGRVTCFLGDAKQSPSPNLWDFDVVVCNPPYIPRGDLAELDVSVREYEPKLALDGGEDGLDFYRVIVRHWRDALRLNGTLLFEVGIGQGEAVAQIMKDSGYVDIKTYPDPAGILRVVEGRITSEAWEEL